MHKSDLVELKYISEAGPNICLQSLISIIDVTISLNTRRSVTGNLFFDKGYFGQILEDARSEIEEIWGRIKNDPRHSNIKLIGITEIEERRFPNSSFSLFKAEEFSAAFPEFSELLAKMEEPDLKNLQTMKLLWR